MPHTLVRHRKSGGSHLASRPGAGVHRAAGLSGPTRRYAVIVVMLATMSSLPIIVAIGSGSASVGESVDASGTTPFIPPPSVGPVVVPPPPPPPPPAIPAEPPVPAGVAEHQRAVSPKREPRTRRPVRKTKRPVRSPESAPLRTPPARPTEPVKPAKPSPSTSPSISPTSPITPRPTFPTPDVPTPTEVVDCWPDLDPCVPTHP